MPWSRFALLVALVVVSACDPDDDEMTSFGQRTFLSESVEGRALVPGTQVRLGFDESREIMVSADCNSMGSAYELSDGTIVVGEFSSTEIGCSEPLYEQDEWLQSFFAASPSYTLDGPRLTLRDGDVTLVMLDREVADPDLTLQGRTWAVDGLITGGGVGFGPSPQQATLEFDEDGELAITTPCARGRAAYEARISTLELSGVGIGEADCQDDENATLIDDHMRGVLVDGTLDYEIDAGRMQLMRGSIGLWLTAN